MKAVIKKLSYYNKLHNLKFRLQKRIAFVFKNTIYYQTRILQCKRIRLFNYKVFKIT